MSKRPTKRQVWHPAEYDPQDIRAIQALALYAQEAVRPSQPGQEARVPTPLEVKRALDWIINDAAKTYDNGTAASLDANDPHGRIAAFVDGCRFVGQQIVKLMKIKPSVLEGK